MIVKKINLRMPAQYRKAQGFSHDQLLGLILLLMVIVLILIAVFKEDILVKLRLIPDLSNKWLQKGENASLPEPVPMSEGEKVYCIARVMDNFIYFYKEAGVCNDNTLEKSNLLWEVKNNKGEITSDRKWILFKWDIMGNDYNLGIFVENGVIYVPYQLFFESPEYNKYRDKLPALKYVQRLGDSMMVGNEIYSKKIVKPEDFPVPVAKLEENQIKDIEKEKYMLTNIYISGEKIYLSSTKVIVGSIKDSKIVINPEFKQKVGDKTTIYYKKLPLYYQNNLAVIKIFLNELDGAEIKGDWIFNNNPVLFLGNLDLLNKEIQVENFESPTNQPDMRNVPTDVKRN